MKSVSLKIAIDKRMNIYSPENQSCFLKCLFLRLFVLGAVFLLDSSVSAEQVSKQNKLQCSSLFFSDSKTVLSRIEIFDEHNLDQSQLYQKIKISADRAAQIIKALYQQKNNLKINSEKQKTNDDPMADLPVDLTTNLKNEFDQSYVPDIEKLLRIRKIEFKIEFINKKSDDLFNEVSYPVFIIEPTLQSSKINKFAAGLFKLSGVKLIYAPHLSRVHGFASAYFPELNSIILHDQSILGSDTHQFSDSRITPHEIKHALYEAERRGRYKSQGKSPVHGYFEQRSSPLKSSSEFKPTHYSFEELITYTYTITAEAKKLKRDHKNIESAVLNKSVETFFQYSVHSLNVVERALWILKNQPSLMIEYQKNIVIQLGESAQLILQVPQVEQQRYLLNPLKYARIELEKLKKLSEFNRDWVLKSRNTEDFLDKAEDLRSEQVNFLDQLSIATQKFWPRILDQLHHLFF